MNHNYMTLSIIPDSSFNINSTIPKSELTLQIIPKLSLNLIKQKPSIPRRTRITKYTLEIVLERVREIHGNKYDYSNIKPEHIQGRDSHIPVKCNNCYYEWVRSRRDPTWDELCSS